jgi:hypothetical protein
MAARELRGAALAKGASAIARFGRKTARRPSVSLAIDIVGALGVPTSSAEFGSLVKGTVATVAVSQAGLGNLQKVADYGAARVMTDAYQEARGRGTPGSLVTNRHAPLGEITNEMEKLNTRLAAIEKKSPQGGIL